MSKLRDFCFTNAEKMRNAELFVRNALQDTDGLSVYVTKVIEQFGKHSKQELVYIRNELKRVKPSSASEAGARLLISLVGLGI